MRKHVLKIVFIAVSIILTLSTSAASTPEIDKVEPWPSDVSHGDYLYVDAEISDSSGSVSSAWFEVQENGEVIGKGKLSDSNNDGYYVSPGGAQIDGGERYRVEVNACNGSNKCISKSTSVESECSLELLGECRY